MVMLVNIRRGAGKSVVGQVPCPLDLKRPKYDRLKFCIATVLLPRPTPLMEALPNREAQFDHQCLASRNLSEFLLPWTRLPPILTVNCLSSCQRSWSNSYLWNGGALSCSHISCVVSGMLKTDPVARFTIQHIKKHRYVLHNTTTVSGCVLYPVNCAQASIHFSKQA